MLTWLDFPVIEYGGTKSILLSTRTVIGGKNPFLGIAYVVVGGLCVLLGALFTVAHLVKPRYVQIYYVQILWTQHFGRFLTDWVQKTWRPHILDLGQ